MDSELWVYLQKQMHMVWHDFHFDDFKLVFVGYGSDELLLPHIHTIHQYFATILRAKNDMVLTGIHDIVI